MIIPKKGILWTKFIVPSTGSTNQVYSLLFSWSGNSSELILCPGNSLLISSNKYLLILTSVSVTGSLLVFHLIFDFNLKSRAAILPACFIIFVINGLKLCSMALLKLLSTAAWTGIIAADFLALVI